MALALSTVLLAGCWGEDIVVGTTDEGVEKRGEAEVRSDLEPLTDRFPALGSPVGAEWMSGTLGGGRAPGPSTYWIDGVVHLEDDVADDLRTLATEQATAAPTVADDLRDRLPDGPLLRGDALDETISAGGFAVEAYLDEDEPLLVIVAVGE
ncbi:hypothetical protein [Georgenia alba]|uniref:DUF3352 domain-containing protein n=1 Tax=Georgenia alba TaxID=2233858 RepID=A0ABW2Q8X9_9MICO